jgi:cephalosporin hydroxylase
VLQELALYSPLVSPGSYLVVEDTNSDGVPVFPGSVGPTAAVQEFLATPAGKAFTQDASREAMVLTFNPGGWLKKAE